MKKFFVFILFSLILLGNIASESKFPEYVHNYVYLIYKIEIKSDLNRTFYSQTLGYPELKDQPHTTGYGDGSGSNQKPLFKSYDDKVWVYKGVPAGEFAFVQIKQKKGTLNLDGFSLNIFGSRYGVSCPLSNSSNESVLSFDPKAKYVYAGTFVYEFVDGTIFPRLVEVRDEYEQAKEWATQMADVKELQLSRAEIN